MTIRYCAHFCVNESKKVVKANDSLLLVVNEDVPVESFAASGDLTM